MDFSPVNPSINELITEIDDKKGIINIWGDSGSGKTTMCLSASLSILVRGKKVIYINTRPEFKIQRYKMMRSAYRDYDEYNLLLYNIDSFQNFVKLIMNLEYLILKEIEFLGETKIGLIVVDTLTTIMHINMDSEESNQKMQYAMNNLLATLDYINATYQIPVIITNRMISKYSEIDNRVIEQTASSKLVNFFAKFSIKIERSDIPSFRVLFLEKHISAPIRRIRTQISKLGFE